MDEIFSDGATNDGISIERCRELLGDEAIELCDDEIERIQRCANAVAEVVIEVFVDANRPTIH